MKPTKHPSQLGFPSVLSSSCRPAHTRAKMPEPAGQCRARRSFMPKFVIEREIPGAGKMTDAQARETALKSVGVLKNLGPQIQWLHSYVTDDKVYCVYVAPDEETILEHARRAGFPANRVSAVRRLSGSRSGTFLCRNYRHSRGSTVSAVLPRCAHRSSARIFVMESLRIGRQTYAGPRERLGFLLSLSRGSHVFTQADVGMQKKWLPPCSPRRLCQRFF